MDKDRPAGGGKDRGECRRHGHESKDHLAALLCFVAMYVLLSLAKVGTRCRLELNQQRNKRLGI